MRPWERNKHMSNDVEWIKLYGGGASEHTTLIAQGAETASVTVNVDDDIQRELYLRSDMTIDTPHHGRVAIFNRAVTEPVKLTWLCPNCYAGIATPHNKLDITPDRFQSCRFCGNPSAKIAVDKWLARYYDDGSGWRGSLVDKELADKVESCDNDQLDELVKVVRLVAIKRDLYSRYEDNDE